MSDSCRTLLLVGGGHAHIQVIKDLAKPKGDKHRFVLVSEDETATYSYVVLYSIYISLLLIHIYIHVM